MQDEMSDSQYELFMNSKSLVDPSPREVHEVMFRTDVVPEM